MLPVAALRIPEQAQSSPQTPLHGRVSTGASADAARPLRRADAAAPAGAMPSPGTTDAAYARQATAAASLPRYRQPEQQQRIGALQQGLVYAARLDGALSELKQALSRQLAGAAMPEAELAERLQGLQRVWEQRGTHGSGQIDTQLCQVAEGELPQQSFRIRGIDANALSQGGTEMLRLALPGLPRPLAVLLDGQGLERQLQSLQQALAPTSLNVALQDGEPVFSVPEAQWPALRDGLSLRGDGKRFPSGQLVRATLQPQADALATAAWPLEGMANQRRVLVQLVQAQERLRTTRTGLAVALTDLDGDTTATATDATQVQDFAAGFARCANAGVLNIERLTELLPAVVSVRRRSVEQLLLKPTS